MKRFLSIAVAIAVALIAGCKPQSHYQMKGIILDPTDLTSVEWVKMAAENGINTIGTHMAPGCKAMCAEISEFILSEKGLLPIWTAAAHGRPQMRVRTSARE